MILLLVEALRRQQTEQHGTKTDDNDFFPQLKNLVNRVILTLKLIFLFVIFY